MTVIIATTTMFFPQVRQIAFISERMRVHVWVPGIGGLRSDWSIFLARILVPQWVPGFSALQSDWSIFGTVIIFGGRFEILVPQ